MSFFYGSVIAFKIETATVLSAWFAVRLWQFSRDVGLGVTIAPNKTARRSGPQVTERRRREARSARLVSALQPRVSDCLQRDAIMAAAKLDRFCRLAS